MKLFILCFFLFTLTLAQKPGDNVFSGVQVHTFVFHFEYPDYLDSLYQSNAEGNYILGNVSINGIDFDSIAVRFKGTSSFNNYPGNKKSFRIKFHEYKEHQFDGLKRINLNNGWSDPTMLREKLYLDFLNQRGIIAPRANFAAVYIDSLFWGLYTMVEQVDKTFLSHRYNNNDGNLYKAEGQSYLDWKGINQENYYAFYDLKTNEKENNRDDLVQLLDVINNSSNDDFIYALENVFNVGSFIRAWSANNFVINLDSYFGSANNFYLYNDEDTGQFNWIIWDTNLAFGARSNSDSLDIFWRGAPRPLIQRLLAIPEYHEMYIQQIKEIEKAFEKQLMIDKIDTLFAIIKSFYFSDSLKMYTNEEAQENLVYSVDRNPGLKSFIVNRKQNVTEQLSLLINSMESKTLILTSPVLIQNYPNPFNSKTMIRYIIGDVKTHHDVSPQVKLSIYNLLGREVATLVNKKQPAGRYAITFDAKQLASGIYFYILRISPGFISRRKMILIK